MLDIVNGIIIGDIDIRRHFGAYINDKCICTGNYETKELAIQDFKSKYPETLKNGFELRIYNY